MGQEIASGTFTRDDRTRYRRKVRKCLDVFALMLKDLRFDADEPMTGLELEVNLIDESADPAMINHEVLAALGNPLLQRELGKFNIEFNARPRLIAGAGLADYETDILATLGAAEECARRSSAHLVMCGIMPTLTQAHAVLENLSTESRYLRLNEQIMEARGSDLEIDIHGPERLEMSSDSIAPEAACTSVQFHLQVAPSNFASYWNAAQAVAGVQLAVGANSPFLFGHRLWAETRVPLFEQATDTRPEEMKNQGVRPRVWFGERWITSIFDLFEENVRYFPALLPICNDEDPVEALAAGIAPSLAELRLHSGTVYRWNRPVYDVTDRRPHLRVENRVLPAGPSVVDLLANAAFYFGLVRELVNSDRPVWTSLTFDEAEANFYAGARHGIDARLQWPRIGGIEATALVLEHLLPMAYAGLDSFGADPGARDRLLGIIEARCSTGVNGASWQVDTVRRLESNGMSRPHALREMLRRYAEHGRANEPVHTWPSE
jgi:hypothetical protein